LAQGLERLITKRVDSRADGQGVPDQHMQALDPGRHSTGRDASDLGDVTQLTTTAQVVLMGRDIGRGQLSVAA
jgi:hypothetical protein